MTVNNGTMEGLVEQYKEIVGNSDNHSASKEELRTFEYYSMYEKSDYETRTYSNLNHVKI